ncbi:MAG: ROK family protein [Cyclobacteriaceae bacterium]|nr:ROK family protein [Cyclobacteriaceae bacterium]
MKKLAIGIDIGGTNTKFGCADREGNVFFQDSILTTGHKDFNAYVHQLSSSIHQKISTLEGNPEIIGIGVGAPNGNIYTGTIEDAPNLPWKTKIPLVNILEKEFKLPVILTNDANAAAIGEQVYGGAKDMKDFVVITLGTGLGSGIVANGQLVYGHDGYAGELGHVNVKPNGRQCGCGKRGCLETYASATGIQRTIYKLLADYNTESELRDISFNALNTKMISDAAKRGDKIALQAFEYTGEILGRKLADTVVHTSPEAFFIFGGLANAGSLIINPTKQAMEDNLMSFYRNKIKIIPSGLDGAKAAILGASSLIWKKYEEKQE